MEPQVGSQTSSEHRGTALVVDDEQTNRFFLSALLINSGFNVIEAVNGQEAVELKKQEVIDIIFMDVMMPVMDGIAATKIIKADTEGVFTPVIFLTAMSDSEDIARCIDAGGDDVLTKPYDANILEAKIIAQERIRDLHRNISRLLGSLDTEHEMAHHVHDYIFTQRNAKVNEVRSTIVSAARFSGDALFTAYTPNHELYIMLSDFTGHGLPAALAAMPVASIFHNRASKGYSARYILNECNQQLCDMLPGNMFMAAQFAVFSLNTNSVQLYNCGMPEIFVMDGKDNTIRHRVESSAPPLGLNDKLVLRPAHEYSIQSDDHVFLYSDGITEARNDTELLYTDSDFNKKITSLSDVTTLYDELLDDFHQATDGHELEDDVSLVDIHYSQELFSDSQSLFEEEQHGIKKDNFDLQFDLLPGVFATEPDLSITLTGKQLLNSDPVPLLVENVDMLTQLDDNKTTIYLILSELIVNAIDHGALGLESELKNAPDGFEKYMEAREQRLSECPDAFVKIQFRLFSQNGRSGLAISIKDSGKGFNFDNYFKNKPDVQLHHGRGVFLVNELCDTLEYKNDGSYVEATISWQ